MCPQCLKPTTLLLRKCPAVVGQIANLPHFAAGRRLAPRGTRRPARAGLTLVELLVGAAVMAIVATALAALANAVYLGAEYSGGHGEAVQNARVTLERITRLASEATTSPRFPGMIVVAAEQNAHSFPDTLVIWHPTTTPLDPAGLPRFNELAIYCPDADRPNELIELTAPGDTRTVPEYTDLNDWAEEIEALKASSTARRVILTSLVRTASADATGSATNLRACVRFNVRYRPSDADLAKYEADEVSWEELPWVQNIYSHSLGLRQVWLRIELQLMPGSQAKDDTDGGQTAIPFFDSASVHYTLKKVD